MAAQDYVTDIERMEAARFCETLVQYLLTNPHGVTTQKTNTDIFTAVSTSDLVHHR
jgi:hypothetical protein